MAARKKKKSTSKAAIAAKSRQRWPLRAISLFILFLIVVYSLVFFTGDHRPIPKLGIDLQGGTRVTLVPQGKQPDSQQLEQARKILENRVNGMGVSGATVQTDGSTLVITVPGEDSAQARTLGQTSQLLFRPVNSDALQGTDPTTLPQVATDMANRWVKAGILTVDEAKDGLSKLGTALQSYYQQMGQADAQAPAMEVTAEPDPAPANSIEEAKARQSRSEILLADRQSEDGTTLAAAVNLLKCGPSDLLAGQDDPAKPLVTCDVNGTPMVLDPAPLLSGVTDPSGPRLTGEEIDTSAPITGGYDSQSGQMAITFKFKTSSTDKGGETWADLTTKYQGKQVAITLDSQVISAPTIQSPTPAGSTTQITGQFTQAEAQDLANNLKYGALPISFAGENGEKGGTATTIPATLGFASLKAGLIAGLVGLALVGLYALAYYRGLGLITLFSLVLSATLVYGTLVLLGRWIGYSLDLAGIAGLIIGIGTTADSFVVYFERIKDEVRDGRTFRSAVPRAWTRARRTVLSGNLVSLIAAVVLYILAVGDVKGFAFTLGLTTIYDLFVVFSVSAPLVYLASRRPAFSKPALNGLGGVMKVAARLRAEGQTLPADAGTAESTTGSESDTDTNKKEN